MRVGSLRLRLALAASLLIALALALAGIGLVLIFDRVLDARTAQELDRTAKFLAGEMTVASGGVLSLAAEPADPRFATPYGGLYWQIVAKDGQELRSRSLWDKGFGPAAAPPSTRAGQSFDLAGPGGQRLIAVARSVTVGKADTPLTITVAMDRRELAESRRSYLRLLIPSLLGLGLVLALAMGAFVHQALAPFRALQADLRAVHEGRRSKLPAGFPDEVQPLVDELNRLIEVQDRALARAQTQAGDMAHGLKTPLAVLAAIARRAAEERPGLAREIEEQAEAMSRQVERSLARARAAASGRLRKRATPVAPVVAKLVGALRRLPDAESLVWDVSVANDCAYPGEEDDLTELLGNLLDNARKWAHRRVVVRSFERGPDRVLRIEDDGPGMSEGAMSRIGRGRRWDETTPGTGFGIAIASDIAEETGARLTLGRSDLGGLQVDLAWPGAAMKPAGPNART